jgi:HEAT repeats
MHEADTARLSPTELVEMLADAHRAFAARSRLIALGSPCQPAVVTGLRHRNPQVRAQCCFVLDHIADTDGLKAVESVLGDPAAEVRIQALHALACDRCKDDECDLDPEAVLPTATAILREDPDAHVRAMAVELVGRWVHDHDEASDALNSAKAADPSPAVRKKASWYAPGGSVWRRSRRGPSRGVAPS